jgi:uncharacterized membrane protein
MKDLGSHLKPGTSTLFIVAKKAKPEAILQKLKSFRGKVLEISLKHDDEDKLRGGT